ncbi:MAG: DUF4105 domain-containing protein [Pseudomonadota bacterium]
MRILGAIGTFCLAVFLIFTMLWGALALWYKLPAGQTVTLSVIGVLLMLGALTVIHTFTRKTRRSLVVYAGAFGILLVWWISIQPPADADWADELARQVTGTIEGDTLRLDNVREFEWRGLDDATQVWSARSYDLGQLQTLDLFLSYWGDPRMAHFMLSFGFSDGEYLAWSVEVRREKDGAYSPIADMFKAHPLIIVAAAEEDVVGVRSNIWENDVYLFRLNAPPETMRTLLELYVADANRLARAPEWYHSILTNCTTLIAKTMGAAGLDVPFDWRILANGYLPELLHELGFLNTEYTVAELRDLGRMAERVTASGLGTDYSDAARAGVPAP